MTSTNNSGVQMSGHASVSGAAVAQGSHPRAEATIRNPRAAAELTQLTDALDGLVDELQRRRAGADAVGMAAAAREELQKATPNRSLIKSLLAGIGTATASMESVSKLVTAAQSALKLLT
jgi:hypothetical protein